VKKSVVLLERPIRREFDEPLKHEVETVVVEYCSKAGVKIVPRWHKTDPRLLLEGGIANFLVEFGPEQFRVTAELAPLAGLLDNQKTRSKALAVIDEMAEKLRV